MRSGRSHPELDSCWELRITGYTRNEVVAVLRLDVDAVGDESIEVAAVVHLVRLNEAVVISGPLGVVTRFGVDADGLEARSIVVGGERIVVGCRGVSTTCDFKFIADAVAVGVAEASAVAIVSGFCVFARAVVVCGSAVIVARSSIGASCDFKLVAHAVAVCIIQAVAIAVVSGIWSVSFAITCTFGDAVTATHATLVELEA